MTTAELDAKRDEMAEVYGKEVRKNQVSRMPAHFATGDLPKWDGSSDFQAKAAFSHGWDACRALLQPSGGDAPGDEEAAEKHASQMWRKHEPSKTTSAIPVIMERWQDAKDDFLAGCRHARAVPRPGEWEKVRGELAERAYVETAGFPAEKEWARLCAHKAVTAVLDRIVRPLQEKHERLLSLASQAYNDLLAELERVRAGEKERE